MKLSLPLSGGSSVGSEVTCLLKRKVRSRVIISKLVLPFSENIVGMSFQRLVVVSFILKLSLPLSGGSSVGSEVTCLLKHKVRPRLIISSLQLEYCWYEVLMSLKCQL